MTVDMAPSAGATPMQPIMGATGQLTRSVSWAITPRTGTRRTYQSSPMAPASAPAPGM